jgi:hypothetical protein
MTPPPKIFQKVDPPPTIFGRAHVCPSFNKSIENFDGKIEKTFRGFFQTWILLQNDKDVDDFRKLWHQFSYRQKT